MFIPSGGANKKEIDRIRRLVDARLNSLVSCWAGFQYEAVIAETQCTEPDCVPIETIIGIILIDNPANLNILPRKFTTKVLKPLMEVKHMDILQITFPFHINQDTEQVKLENTLKELRASLSKLDQVESLSLAKDFLKGEVIELERRIKVKNSEKNLTIVTITPINTSQSSSAREISSDSKPFKEELIQQEGPVMSALASYSNSQTAPVAPSAEPSRHEKGQRRRGCPCCDPDNLDRIIDKIMFMDNTGI